VLAAETEGWVEVENVPVVVLKGRSRSARPSLTRMGFRSAPLVQGQITSLFGLRVDRYQTNQSVTIIIVKCRIPILEYEIGQY
jgi:hypothetical protein